MSETAQRKPWIVSPADARGFSQAYHREHTVLTRFRLLLPAETRCVELSSVGAMLFSAFLCLGQAGMAPMASFLCTVSLLHILAVMFEPPTALLRSGCIFIETMIWSFLAATHVQAYPGFELIPAGPGSFGLALGSAWAFLARLKGPAN